jgi:hypothetical protein
MDGWMDELCMNILQHVDPLLSNDFVSNIVARS